jgi:hypothetical protein
VLIVRSNASRERGLIAMKELREFAERWLWLAALVVGAGMLVWGLGEHNAHNAQHYQATLAAAIQGGALLVAASLICVTFGRRNGP